MNIADEKSLIMQVAPYSDGLYHQPVVFAYEQFEPIPGFNNRYFISTLGRVYDSKNKCHCIPFVDKYLRYSLRYGENDFTQEFAQRLMMMTFNPIPNMENMVVVFLDQNPLNLVLDNLQWMDTHGRRQYLVDCGIGSVGENHYQTKYTENQVRRICQLLEKKIKPEQIKMILLDLPEDPFFNEFCTRLRTGHAWKHVTKDYNLELDYTRFSKDDIFTVCGLLSQNKTTQEIASILGLPMDTRISNLCSNLRRRNPMYKKYTDMYPNIPYAESRNNEEITLEQIEEIMRLKSQKYTVVQISNILNPTNPNINKTKLYGLFSRIKKDPNAKGRDIAIKYGIIKE